MINCNNCVNKGSAKCRSCTVTEKDGVRQGLPSNYENPVREKLIELLEDLGVSCDVPINVDADGCGSYDIMGADYIADHLIAKGVTIPVRCKECERLHHSGYCRKLGMEHDRLGSDFCSYGERRTNV